MSIKYFTGIAVFLAGQITLISLMLWQIERIDEKQTQLKAIATAEKAPILDLSAQSTFDSALWQTHLFRRVKLEGRWVAVEPVRANIISTDTDNQARAAFRLFAPFKTAAGIVIVDLGYTLEDTRPQPIPASDNITITGRLWPNEKTSLFALEDSKSNRLMFTIRSDRASEWMGVESPADGLIRLTEPAGGLDALGPLNLSRISSLKPANNHLGYAITWGGLSIVWALMGIFAFMGFLKQRAQA